MTVSAVWPRVNGNCAIGRLPPATHSAIFASRGVGGSRIVASDEGILHTPHSPRNVAITDWSNINWSLPANLEKYARADVFLAMTASLWSDQYRDQPIIDGIALGKIPDDADCAKAVMFLCTDWASVVSGAALDINGGEWMP